MGNFFYEQQNNPNEPIFIKNVYHQIQNEVLIPVESPIDNNGQIVASPVSGCKPDTNNLEFITVFNGELNGVAIVDRLIRLQRPATGIVVAGMTGSWGGTAQPPYQNVFLSLQPSGFQTDPATGFIIFPSLLSGVFDLHVFPALKFCRPITKFYISAAQQGAPASMVVLATSDLDLYPQFNSLP